MSKQIDLHNGTSISLSDDDYDVISNYKCYTETRKGIVVDIKFIVVTENGKVHVNLDRYICRKIHGASWKFVKHIDGNVFNNTRENLVYGKSTYKDRGHTPWLLNIRTSDYKGVRNRVIDKQIDEIDEALAYDIKVIEKYGDFADTNFLRYVPVS